MSTGTIYALSSAAGRAGVAVIRLSGPGAGPALAALSGKSLPKPRAASLCELAHPKTNAPLDRALSLWFPAPASFTGEDVAELHIHGGRAVIAAVLDALGTFDDLRPAEPGEFTRRAFEAGKMDLTAVEGLADLIDAETEAQRRQALRQMEGALAGRVALWRRQIIKLAALVAADIDFPDEDGVPGGLLGKARPGIKDLANELEAELVCGQKGVRLREGLEVAILGAPNAGKSSILNALAGREAAIVSATAGTTRDVVEVQMDLGGYPVTLADTAGLRDASDEIESEGIKRALARAQRADLRLVLFDATLPPDPQAKAQVREGDIVLISKADLSTDTPDFLRVSVKTGEGLDTLEARLRDEVVARAGITEAPTLTRARHIRALEDAIGALTRAEMAQEAELCGEDLRLAARALERLMGKVDVEDLLDVVFAEFCIGK